jgi:hypothetical protein
MLLLLLLLILTFSLFSMPVNRTKKGVSRTVRITTHSASSTPKFPKAQVLNQAAIIEQRQREHELHKRNIQGK